MPPTAKELTIGLVLIVVGLIADIGASYALPAPPSCTSLACNVAEGVGLVSLLLLILGIGVQIRALSRMPSPASGGPAPSPSGAPLPPWAVASPPPTPPLAPSAPFGVPVRPYNGVTPPARASATGPEVQCGRCRRTSLGRPVRLLSGVREPAPFCALTGDRGFRARRSRPSERLFRFSVRWAG